MDRDFGPTPYQASDNPTRLSNNDHLDIR